MRVAFLDLDHTLLPAVVPLAPGLLSELRAQGFTTVVVSATRASLVEPVARHLAVDHLITSCFGPQKVHQVEAWLKAQGCTLAGLEEGWFYSDSHNDLPLLEAVCHPVAVDPDPRLAQLVAQRQWPVISLRLPGCSRQGRHVGAVAGEAIGQEIQEGRDLG